MQIGHVWISTSKCLCATCVTGAGYFGTPQAAIAHQCQASGKREARRTTRTLLVTTKMRPNCSKPDTHHDRFFIVHLDLHSSRRPKGSGPPLHAISIVRVYFLGESTESVPLWRAHKFIHKKNRGSRV